MEDTFAYTKWLRGLLYLALLSLINDLVNQIPFVPGGITAWVSRGIMAGKVFCMLQLAGVNERYRKAGIFRGVMLGCALVTSFLFGSYLLTLAASVCSFVAVYQEFCGHGEVVGEKDAVLARQWNRLFYWEIGVSLLLSFGTAITAAILMAAAPQVSAGKISGMVISLLNIPTWILNIVYMLYLKRMIRCFDTGEA